MREPAPCSADRRAGAPDRGRVPHGILSPMSQRKTASKKSGPPHLSERTLAAMIEEATVDCYNESEQIMGWFTMIEDNLEVPFETTVLGVQVTVERVDLTQSEQIVAICRRGDEHQSLPILDLRLPTPALGGA